MAGFSDGVRALLLIAALAPAGAGCSPVQLALRGAALTYHLCRDDSAEEGRARLFPLTRHDPEPGAPLDPLSAGPLDARK